MKKLSLLLLMIVLLVFLPACRRGGLEIPEDCRHLPVVDGWVPVWCDEFEGSELNPDKWTALNTSWGGGNEAQYYRPENVKVEDGLLVITAKQENYGGKNYTSGRIHTQYKRGLALRQGRRSCENARGQGHLARNLDASFHERLRNLAEER